MQRKKPGRRPRGDRRKAADQKASRDKQAAALRLKIAGHSYRTIAQRLGYAGPSGAHKAIQSALLDTVRDAADELRSLEAARLDKLFVRAFAAVTKREDLTAIDPCIKIMARRAKLLGLDAAQELKVETSTTDPHDEVLRELARIAERSRAGEDPPAATAREGGDTAVELEILGKG